MSHSEIVKLNDVCEFIVDCEHKTAPTQETGYPSIRTPNIGRGRLILENVNRVSEEIYIAWTKRAVPKAGDLILAREAPVGNVAIIPENLDVCLGQRTVLIRADTTKVDNGYLLFLLLSDEMQGKILSRANGSTVHHLNMRDIRNLELPKLPPLATQQRIAEILSTYDRLIDNNNRRIALLEESIHLLYKEWFVRLRFPGHESVKLVDGIPEGWNRVLVTKLIDFNPKTSAPKGEIRPYVPMEAVSTNSMIISEVETRPVGGGAKFKNGDTLLARITPCLENGKTAFVQFMENDDMVATGSTEFIVMRSTQVTPYWVYCLARSYNFRQHAINSMAGSDGRQRVKPDCFEQYQVISPPSHILKSFDTIASPIFKQIKFLSWQNQKLKEARDLLLPRLMNGSIAV